MLHLFVISIRYQHIKKNLRKQLDIAIIIVYTYIVFTWDVNKAISNFEKHGVSFEEAATAFTDCDGLHIEDVKHSQKEHRFFRI